MINQFAVTGSRIKQSIKESLINRILKMVCGNDFQYKKGRLIINTPLNIHCTDTIALSSDKHILLSSGRKQEDDRPGYNYGVWLNPDLDNFGRPLQTLSLVNDKGNKWNWSIDFDSEGNVSLPSGWKIFGDGDCGHDHG